MKTGKAAFAAGCFWGVEEAFRKLKGVINTKAGYMGGNTKNPAYEEVCTGKTNHAETVQITFNPSIISYEKLLNIFWSIHDPTILNRQWLDIGTQYMSIIFYYNKDQKDKAVKSKEKISEKYKNNIVTEIIKASEFYNAEEYHQKYLMKRKLKVC